MLRPVIIANDLDVLHLNISLIASKPSTSTAHRTHVFPQDTYHLPSSAVRGKIGSEEGSGHVLGLGDVSGFGPFE